MSEAYYGQLSKWWRTPSAQESMERAKTARKDRLEKLKADFAERKQEQENAVKTWEVKQ
jgi:hypothetical protein